MAHLPMLLVLLLLAFALLCLTALVLAACVRRKGAVRGFVRAGSMQLGIEIDPNPPDGPGPRS
jgi:hypothetical protein